jgi:polysaccharide export outer membrane protein
MMMSRRLLLLPGAFSALLLAADVASAQDVSAAAALPASAPAPGPIAGATAAVPSNYRIGPDDTLEVVVFQVPELSRTVQVNSEGVFTLPFVGNVQAAGHTADEVATTLHDRLNGGYLRDPQVTVLVKQAVSQRVTIDGAVVKPGIYSLTGPTSLLQAIALANGPDPKLANVHKVALFRTVQGQRHSEVFDLVSIRDGKIPDPVVQPDDVIVVDTSGVRSFFNIFGPSLPVLSAVRFF